jgi:hypothetical protein
MTQHPRRRHSSVLFILKVVFVQFIAKSLLVLHDTVGNINATVNVTEILIVITLTYGFGDVSSFEFRPETSCRNELFILLLRPSSPMLKFENKQVPSNVDVLMDLGCSLR